jgi:hypothetical protein
VAHDIVTGEAIQASPQAKVSLFDLQLGEGPVWTISEEPTKTSALNGREEIMVSALPAWAANTRVDLRDASNLGFPLAARMLAEALGVSNWYYEASQTAMARYSAVGFEAAAVTALMLSTSAHSTRPGWKRTARLRFVHPYAVIAAACDDPYRRTGAPTATWRGLPVFSAWVSEPRDAD